MGPGEDLLEDLARHRHQTRMGDPRAVVSVRDFATLVGADFAFQRWIG